MENAFPLEQKNQEQPKASFWSSFREFLKQYSVIGLAIGVVMGTAVNALVQSFVQGLITPLIELLLPGQGLSKLTFVVRGSSFRFGDVLSAVLHFAIIAFLIFFTVKKLLKQEELLKKK